MRARDDTVRAALADLLLVSVVGLALGVGLAATLAWAL